MRVRNPKLVPRMTNKTEFKPGDKVNQAITGKRARRQRRHPKPGVVLRVFGNCVIVRFKNEPKGIYPTRLLMTAADRAAK